MAPEDWLKLTPKGLYCLPGDFHIDPLAPAARAVITHGHGDHARSGHDRALATRETIAIMRLRLGEGAPRQCQALDYGESLSLGDATLWLRPAGHILGSAQVVIEYAGCRVVVSGDYKRRIDPTCPPFEVQACDLFVTEATFALPVFRHPEPRAEARKLLASLRSFPDRCHLVGVYALGKAQRLLKLLRLEGYDRPIHLHGALAGLTDLYRDFGQDFGELRPATGSSKRDLAGAIVMAPPSALAERWARGLPDPIHAMASGWMGIRARARQRGVELPLVISDHADWDELLATLVEVGAPRVWVTHGREDALVHQAARLGIQAEALSIAGYEDDA